MARLIVNVPVQDIEADEIWSFIQKKEKQVTEDDDPNYGDAYCFVAIERNTKLVVNFALGKRNQATTDIFIEGSQGRRESELRGGFRSALNAPRQRVAGLRSSRPQTHTFSPPLTTSSQRRFPVAPG